MNSVRNLDISVRSQAYSLLHFSFRPGYSGASYLNGLTYRDASNLVEKNISNW